MNKTIKTIGRLLIILLVVCLVAGGLYWLVKANPSLLGLVDGRRGGLGDRLHQPGFKALPGGDDWREVRPSQDFEGRGGEHYNQIGVFDARSISGILHNLLIIALTTVAVLAIQKIISLIRQHRQAKVAQQQPIAAQPAESNGE